MIPSTKIRVPLLELSILAVVLVIGWATLRLSHLATQPTRSPEMIEAAAPGPGQMQNIHRMQEAFSIREEYSSLAEHLRTNVTALQAALVSFVSRHEQPDLLEFHQKSEALRGWIEKQRERANLERFPARSSELKEMMEENPTPAPGGEALLKWDLGSFLGQADLAYTNYIREARQIINTTSEPLESALASQRLQPAGAAATKLLELAREARSDGAALEHFLNERLGPPVMAATGDNRRFVQVSISRPVARQIRVIFYAMIAVLVALTGVFVFSIYQRTVVAPLRMKLFESRAVIEQQNKLAHFGQLAAVLAHEIRNPLTAINARLYTLQKSLTDGTPEYKDALVMHHEINRLDQIVKEFLVLARPAEPKLAPLRAEPVLRQIQELLSPQYERQGIQLKVDSAVETPFRADLSQIKQVLINLVRNAADAIGQQGTITLRARQERVPLKGGPTDAVLLEVEDTGSGIPVEVQERLFDPFFSTKEDGTGLGLAIAARIIDKHGGALDFDTRLGQGTTFRVVLPAHNT